MKSKINYLDIIEYDFDKNVSFTKLFSKIDPVAVDLLRKILVYNPDKRLSAE